MKAAISNYKRSRHSQKSRHMIVFAEGVKNRKDAQALKGKEIVFTTSGKHKIKGKVAAAHGNKGAVRVIFQRGLPGQSLGQKAEIN
jgi:large subunit ribosomal protein L35Ae